MRYLTVEEAAAYSTLSERTVRYAIERGDLTVLRHGRRIVIRAADVDDWLLHRPPVPAGSRT